jgi:glycosyltransferase involved in cell wall biosynthesis
LTSTVTLEAIALGLPVICLNHCGFSHVINESCGIKIPVTTPENISIGFKTAIEKLYENEVLRQQLSQGAFLRAKSFLWEGKINKLNQVYTHLLNESSTNS